MKKTVQDNTVDFSDESYAKAGVSIFDQNETNKQVISTLNSLGMDAKGLFGGAVDISNHRGGTLHLDMGISGIVMKDSPEESGKATAEAALAKAHGTPIGTLDYFASEKMGGTVVDFVKGVALASMRKQCNVLGGETAQMPNTYKPGKCDGFVHALSLNKLWHGINITDMIKDMQQPIVVATTDGTGTKTKIVKNPADIIFHGFNDLSQQGVKPLGFGIYISGNVPLEDIVEIDKKARTIADNYGIRMFPSGMNPKNKNYLPGEVDIAGTVFGIIDKKDLILGKDVHPGDKIIGIHVDGLMTNGYSLARRLGAAYAQSKGATMDTPLDELNGESFNQALSKPHRPMTDILFGDGMNEGVLIKYKGDVKGQAHITGGGLPDNSIRMVPKEYQVVMQKDVLAVPPIMALFRKNGLKDEECFPTFNMGVGYVLIVNEDAACKIVHHINRRFRNNLYDVDRQAAIIGYIADRKSGDERFRFEN